MRRVAVIGTSLAVIACALAVNHQVALTKDAQKMQPVNGQAAAQLASEGKRIVQQKGCNGCHGANLSGKKGFSPSIRRGGVLDQYNSKTFARLMDVGITEDGGKVEKPMPVYHLKAHQSAAIYAYLKTLKK